MLHNVASQFVYRQTLAIRALVSHVLRHPPLCAAQSSKSTMQQQACLPGITCGSVTTTWYSSGTACLSCKPLAQIELDAARLHFRAQMAYNASACLQSSSRAYTAVTAYQPMPSSTPTNKAPRFPLPSQCMCSTANHRGLVLAHAYGQTRLHHTAPLFSLAPLKQQPSSTECLKACVMQGTRLQVLEDPTVNTALSQNRDD